ncbi:MAG: Dynamin family protein [Moorea sp. SIO4E2]|uniref:dynamin family protein n=1 Tax=Moorena sp. SIO4E2 TaxID=2607826 RepID=UPI0013B8EA8F|nr:dynamin family protein [Moorena sp. SIO4E2]NEQ07009.1 Dynamin family protein [Moorena sp. SIO4E2]
MDWKTASSYYETRLSDALTVLRHAVDLARLPQAGVPGHLKEVLLEEEKPARRQLERLKKREFRIAVVGLEKAGKSTFVNAWLDCDLLPAKAGRCTFTTTQIYSVEQDSQQRLEVEPKTEEQFTSLLHELESESNSNSRHRDGAKQDLDTIRKYQDTLRQVRSEGRKTLPFSRLEDINKDLNKYVADEQYAHAVLEARLYTNKLVQAEGIVFYDVPGLDSGLAKHIEESREMLSDCDAVIVVQQFSSIRGAELQILEFTEQGDKNVNVADKLFVFLSRIDQFASPAALQEHLDVASKDWYRRAQLSPQRIVHGSAGAYLVLNGFANEQTFKCVGSPESILNKLNCLTGIEDEEALRQEATGIQEIKARITDYINNERVSVLQKRCDALINKILTTSKEIFDIVSKRYPENPAEAKRLQENQRRIEFSQWWEEKWKTIKADLSDYYNDNIRKSTAAGEESLTSDILEKFRSRYLEDIESNIEEIRNNNEQRKERIFNENDSGIFDAQVTNYNWRKELSATISIFLVDIAHNLALEIKEEALKLVDHLTTLLWKTQELEQRLIGNPEQFVELLSRSLTALFLRFARPVADSLIPGPLGSETRQRIVKRLGADIEVVDIYYSGEEKAFSVLRRYVNRGSKLLYDPKLRHELLGIREVSGDVPPKPTNSAEEVILEVETDITAFETYLRSAIFEAAGFEQFCLQELDQLRDRFIQYEAVWRGVAQNEWLEENPLLMAEMPEHLKAHEVNLEVSDRLRQLSTALAKGVGSSRM